MSNGQVPVIATTRDPSTARLPTESGSTAYSLGLEFRAFHDMSILSGETEVIEVVVPFDIDINSIVLNIDAGELTYRAIAGATETAPFTPIPTIFPANTRSDAPVNAPEMKIGIGGAITGGIVTNLSRFKTGTNNQRESIIDQASGLRGVGTGVVYLSLENTGNSTVPVVIYADWSEL